MARSRQDDEDDRFRPKRWVGCPIEEEYFGDERKAGKMQRKMASALDRSKYKKTDREKHRRALDLEKDMKLSKENLLRGRVVSIKPEGIIVDYEGQNFTCVLRGLLKKEKGQFKNLVTVGDFVLFETSSPAEGAIAHVEPRKTILSRADNLSRRKEQLIAANIDQVIITASVVSPPLKPFLIDRYIIAARKGGMAPVIVVNKIDLLDDPSMDESLRESEKSLLEEVIQAYQMAELPVIAVSVESGAGLDALKAAMKDKASVFSGQSGVGKSSLINAVTGYQLKVGKIVDKTQKGAHTTTSAHLLHLEFGGWSIDTPGIKSFGVWDLKNDEVQHYFSEIQSCGAECRFPDCSHMQEAGCAVLEAVEQGKISPMRYQSYQYLMDSISQEHLRR